VGAFNPFFASLLLGFRLEILLLRLETLLLRLETFRLEIFVFRLEAFRLETLLDRALTERRAFLVLRASRFLVVLRFLTVPGARALTALAGASGVRLD